MSCTTTGTSTSTASSGVWYKDLGLRDNTETGINGYYYQVHITVTDRNSLLQAIGWHMSIYQVDTVTNTWNPNNCTGRMFFYPAGVGLGPNDRGSSWGYNLRRMHFFPAWRDIGWDFFFEHFPEYKLKTALVFNDTEFPKFTKSTASSASSASSTSSSASSTTSSACSSSSSASSTSSSGASKSASSK